MKELTKYALLGMPVGLYIILAIIIALAITAFFLPPLAVIDKSVIDMSLVILAAAWLYYTTAHIPDFIQKGAKIVAQTGNSSFTISKSDNENKGN